MRFVGILEISDDDLVLILHRNKRGRTVSVKTDLEANSKYEIQPISIGANRGNLYVPSDNIELN